MTSGGTDHLHLSGKMIAATGPDVLHACVRQVPREDEFELFRIGTVGNVGRVDVDGGIARNNGADRDCSQSFNELDSQLRVDQGSDGGKRCAICFESCERNLGGRLPRKCDRWDAFFRCLTCCTPTYKSR